MNCPDCSAPMNHHASKVIDPRNDDEVARFDSDLGGVVLDRYTCPKCGGSASGFGEPDGAGT